MDFNELKNVVQNGEDSKHQFKVDVTNALSLAGEMSAFSNSQGGEIFIGVSNDNQLTGLSPEDVHRINQLISNAASQNVRSSINVITENISIGNDRVVIRLEVREGIDKPYFDSQGVIWVKNGSDKRRISSKEELRRLFQDVDLLHADEVPIRDAGLSSLDKLRFRDFLKEKYDKDLPEAQQDLAKLLENMNLAQDGSLNLAGLMLFGEQPEFLKPAFVIKAMAFPGNKMTTETYLDSEDIDGPLPQQFHDGMGFIMRNIKKLQGDQSVNSTGEPEIPRIVFEELLVNALIHRDYFISSSIKLLIFDNRIEITSPGHLPNHLTTEKIRTGNSNIRNPILASFVAKKILPYRGLGSGIPRALEDWPDIEFTDDREKCEFTATISRRSTGVVNGVATEQATGQVREAKSGLAGQVTEQAAEQLTGVVTEVVDENIIRLLRVIKGEMKRKDIQDALDLKHEDYFRETYLTPALNDGYIEMTIPDVKTSPNQKYRLTAKGSKALEQ